MPHICIAFYMFQNTFSFIFSSHPFKTSRGGIVIVPQIGKFNCLIHNHIVTQWRNQNLKTRSFFFPLPSQTFYCINFFFWLLQVLVAAWALLSCSMQTLSCNMHAGSSSLNPGTLHWEHSLTHWTTREVPENEILDLKIFYNGQKPRTKNISDAQTVCWESVYNNQYTTTHICWFGDK